MCSVCNAGTEFIRRIEMDWSDLVHLALFNMTAFKPQKYYDVDINILPYLENHLTSMYLPPNVRIFKNIIIKLLLCIII